MTDTVALYHRVSTVDQNPDAAREELKAAAKRYGLTVIFSTPLQSRLGLASTCR